MAKTIPTTKRSSPATNYYLILYNTLSCLGWGYILVITCFHLAAVPFPEILSPTSKGSSHFSFQALVNYIRELIEGLTKEARGALTPSHNAVTIVTVITQLLSIYRRMTTTYRVVGHAVAIVQTAAALEIVHAFSGLVKSPLPTAVMQVYSRLFLVWGVTQKYGQSSQNALYSTMILAWSTTEVIRYAFYALSLARGVVPGVLVYLRYTTFYILYPLGASSEALLIYSSLPKTNPLQGFKDGSWNSWDYFRGLMFVVWWPGLLVMMLHMTKQRRKVYGRGAGSAKLKSS
ncbi:PTPLA-domain-containing protein [Thelephora terrestris]|uniref:Very-long-chain (3R)-3-hydroxyacyl-CoA dehydratase n=1 Tax=Thelephora terrestris TaxID=56493 RepID=A0A9P6HFT0_9AGAM|nr:PTPLA-domain-containing protein [Thelephora terrestris]